MLEMVKAYLPEPLRVHARVAKAATLAVVHFPQKILEGEIARGGESRIVAAGPGVVRKIYGPAYFDYAAKYHRHDEGTFLAAHPSTQFVAVYDHDSRGFTMERLEKPIGTSKAIKRVSHPDELTRFLDSIPDELQQRGIHHHDIHPANILWNARIQQYQLTDFSWARERHETYELFPQSWSHYGHDDRRAVDTLRRELDVLLAPPHPFFATVKNVLHVQHL